MIEETIHIHDKYQCEIKLEYQLERQKQSTTYDIETYVFFPNSLGVNRHTYHKNDFYHDMQTYVRLKTPIVLLTEMVKGSDSPLRKLQTSMERVLSHVSDRTTARYEYQVKMFCCIFKSAIRDHVAFTSSRTTSGDIKDSLVKYFTSLQEITRDFRELRSFINIPTVNKNIFSIYVFGDEYLSLLIESYTYELLECIHKLDFPEKEAYTTRLFELISHELKYREQNHYPSIPDTHSTNEEFIFRTGVLKKYMGSVLFLRTRVKQEGELLEQIIFALAAGIAMIFATGAAFFAQSAYANFSLPVFIVLVVSYMFKDRLKELIRLYLGSKIRNRLFDHKRKIYSSPQKNIGWCKESCTFTKGHKIPQQIMKLRDRDHITDIENDWMGEKIILYRKRIRLFRKELEHIYRDYQVVSINDIMRLNVLKFLSKMDNPKKPVYVLDAQGYRKIYGKRVYHLNMVMKYSMGKIAHYKRFRLVLTRNGIKRIEEAGVGEQL